MLCCILHVLLLLLFLLGTNGGRHSGMYINHVHGVLLTVSCHIYGAVLTLIRQHETDRAAHVKYKYAFNMSYICLYSKTSLSRPTMGPNLNGRFREVIDLRSYNIITKDLSGPK